MMLVIAEKREIKKEHERLKHEFTQMKISKDEKIRVLQQQLIKISGYAKSLEGELKAIVEKYNKAD